MPDPSDEIFHLKGDELISMPSRSMREGLLGKTLEDALQTFFEKYPQIIPGKQIDPASEDPPHFVLLRREMPVGSWSLDHLFVDQKGIMTLVETKLFQNPESRREVIGQIIEYACNAAEAWSGGSARQKATEFWSNQNPPKELDELLIEEFGEELDIDDFWKRVEVNLNNGKIRLIIAADELRPEMRRMIEYLNRDMRNTEVLGLELKCYGAETDSLVLVPRLVGQTQAVIDRKVMGAATRISQVGRNEFGHGFDTEGGKIDAAIFALLEKGENVFTSKMLADMSQQTVGRVNGHLKHLEVNHGWKGIRQGKPEGPPPFNKKDAVY